jgi:hypothetical protein
MHEAVGCKLTRWTSSRCRGAFSSRVGGLGRQVVSGRRRGVVRLAAQEDSTCSLDGSLAKEPVLRTVLEYSRLVPHMYVTVRRYSPTTLEL